MYMKLLTDENGFIYKENGFDLQKRMKFSKTLSYQALANSLF